MRRFCFCSGIICLALTSAGQFVDSDKCILGDFTRKEHGWNAVHHVTNAFTSTEGISFAVTGGDPQFISPPFAFPSFQEATRRLRFTVECAPTPVKNSWQLFFAFGGRPLTSIDSIWLEPEGEPPYIRFSGELPVSFFTTGYGRIRLDPPGGTNQFTIKSLSVSFVKPLWTYRPKSPAELVLPDDAVSLEGEGWQLRHDPRRMGAFHYKSHGKVAEGNPCEPCFVLGRSGKPLKVDWNGAKTSVTKVNDGFAVSATMRDVEDNRWRMIRTFTKVEKGQALAITTRIVCDLTHVLHVPYLTLFTDRASLERKHQALLAGVEYLDDEPSSNTKDIRNFEAKRLIPAAYRFCAPLAIFTDQRSWLAAEWDAPKESRPWTYSTVFDTPDRQFRSGGHLLGFWFPTVGNVRHESELDLYGAEDYTGGVQTVVLRAGGGATVADALERLVRRDNLPSCEKIEESDALRLLAHGWLDSKIRDGVKVRHAIYGACEFKQASDAPALMRWLAAEMKKRPDPDIILINRLQETASAIFDSIPYDAIGLDGVSHIQWPVAPLLTGNIQAWLERGYERLRTNNKNLASGFRVWSGPKDATRNLGDSLGGSDCNGYTAMLMRQLLTDATWSGDEGEIGKALSALDKMLERYRGTVPRGAQPWEMPLHTPDIVASAHMLRCCILGYLLKPDVKYLAEAKYWAYTGLSMVYLVPPPFSFPDGVEPFGLYATCGVMGSTWWGSCNWIGRPVQWCGLVYSAALYDYVRLCQADEGAFWRTIADGIVASGIRQTHPLSEPEVQGLLPDSVNLERQVRYPVPICPGTLQENLSETLHSPYYALRSFPGRKPVIMHMAGDATDLTSIGNAISCRIAAWPDTESRLVLTRIDAPISVTLNGEPIGFMHYEQRRVVIVTLPPHATGLMRVVLP